MGWRGGPPSDIDGMMPVQADLLDPASLRTALQGLRPTHAFISAWLRQETEADNIRINGAMVRNVLDALAPAGSLGHVALVTGLKHYLGPFEAYGKGKLPATPFREDQPRLDVDNFYYAQEDELFAAAGRAGFGWSVHRPHTIIGYAVGNAMNMGVTLAAYATDLQGDRPAIPVSGIGDAVERTDGHDRCHAARPPPRMGGHDRSGAGPGIQRRQRRRLPLELDVGTPGELVRAGAAPFPGTGSPLERQLADAGPIWADLARKHALAESNLAVVVSPWHTDADLGRPIEVVTDMSKSRKLGFLDYQATDDSFFNLFARLRDARIIP
jgi:hypothetical protein